jgi:hypothetical protein
MITDAFGRMRGCRIAPLGSVSTPNSRPERGRMSGSGGQNVGGMCPKSDLTEPVGKLCDSLMRPQSVRDHGSTGGGAWQNKSPNADTVGQSETGFSRLATLIADDSPLHARKIVRDHGCGAGGGGRANPQSPTLPIRADAWSSSGPRAGDDAYHLSRAPGCRNGMFCDFASPSSVAGPADARTLTAAGMPALPSRSRRRTAVVLLARGDEDSRVVDVLAGLDVVIPGMGEVQRPGG